jgi:hypothetical protein
MRAMKNFLLGVLVVAGCGGGGTSSGASALVGTWTVTSGMTTDDCPPASSTDDTNNTVIVSRSTADASKLVLTAQIVAAPAPPCVLSATVSGSTATLDAGQSCTVFSHTFMFKSGSLVTQDGATGAWSATFVNDGPPPGNSVCNDASADAIKRTSM